MSTDEIISRTRLLENDIKVSKELCWTREGGRERKRELVFYLKPTYRYLCMCQSSFHLLYSFCVAVSVPDNEE